MKMKNYMLKQEFSVHGETKQDCKSAVVQLYITEEGIEKQQVVGLFNNIACGFVRFLGEEAGVYDKVFDDVPAFGDIDRGEKNE